MPTRSWNDLLNDAGEGTSFEPLPEGDYDLVITEAKAQQSSTGKMMFVVTCEIESGPYKKRRVWNNFVISPDNQSALGIFFRQMAILGLTREYFEKNPSDHHVAEALVGRRFRGAISIRKWQGQDKNEIKQMYSASGVSAGGMSGTPAPPPPGAGAVPPAPPPSVAQAAPPPPPPVAAPPPPPAPTAAPPVVTPPTPVAAEEAPSSSAQPEAAPAAPPVPPPAPAAAEPVAVAKNEPADAGIAVPPPPPF